jgi:uncharacterized protein
MMKWLRLGLLLTAGMSTAWGVNWKALRPEGYVSDFARVIDPTVKSRLEAYCGAVETSTGAQIALVTIPSLEGEPIEDVANTIFRAWGVGQKGKDEGILMLLAINDRRNRLEVGYGLEPILPDGLSGSVLREMRPALREQRYGEAMMAAAQTIGETIARSKNVTINAEPLPRRVRPTVSNSIPWPLILGGIFLLVWLLRSSGPRGYGGGRGGGGGGLLTALILGNMMGRSTWGSRGSGGFGGFDSGDGGFGGFGGGDSGGGGASSDW